MNRDFHILLIIGTIQYNILSFIYLCGEKNPLKIYCSWRADLNTIQRLSTGRVYLGSEPGIMGGGTSSMVVLDDLLAATFHIGNTIASVSVPGMFRFYDFHSKKAPKLKR